MQKKLEKESNNSDSVNSSNKEIDKFRFLLENLTEEYIKKFEELRGIKTKEVIPVNIFNRRLSPLETIVKFLKENLNHSFKSIGRLLGRNQKTVWQAYNSSRKKLAIIFQEDYSKYNIPISILSDRRFSILELVASYLKENYDLNYHQIALILSRDQRTIWTVYNRVKKKRK